MRSLFLLASLAPALAAAQPGLEAPVEQPTPFVPRWTFAARAGVTALVLETHIEGGGFGPYFELAGGRWISPIASIELFASYQTVADGTMDGDFGYTYTQTRERIVDVAARASYHV